MNSAFGHVSSGLANQISTRAVKEIGLPKFFGVLSGFSILQLLIAFFVTSVMNNNNKSNNNTNNTNNTNNEEEFIKEEVKEESFLDHAKAVTKLTPIYFPLIVCGFLMEGITQTFKNSLSSVCGLFLGLDIIATGNLLFLTKLLVVLKPVSGYLLEKYFPYVNDFVFEIAGCIAIVVHTLSYFLLQDELKDFQTFLSVNSNVEENSIDSVSREVVGKSTLELCLGVILFFRATYEILFFPFLYGTVGKVVNKTRQGVAFGILVSSMALGSFLMPLLEEVLQNSYTKSYKGEINSEDNSGALLANWGKMNSVVSMQLVFIICAVLVVLMGFFIRMLKKREINREIMEGVEVV